MIFFVVNLSYIASEFFYLTSKTAPGLRSGIVKFVFNHEMAALKKFTIKGRAAGHPLKWFTYISAQQRSDNPHLQEGFASPRRTGQYQGLSVAASVITASVKS